MLQKKVTEKQQIKCKTEQLLYITILMRTLFAFHSFCVALIECAFALLDKCNKSSEMILKDFFDELLASSIKQFLEAFWFLAVIRCSFLLITSNSSFWHMDTEFTEPESWSHNSDANTRIRVKCKVTILVLEAIQSTVLTYSTDK